MRFFNDSILKQLRSREDEMTSPEDKQTLVGDADQLRSRLHLEPLKSAPPQADRKYQTARAGRSQ